MGFDANENIIITDYSKTKKVKREIMLNNLKTTSMKEAFVVKGIYEKFHIKGVSHNISDVIAHQYDGPSGPLGNVHFL